MVKTQNGNDILIEYACYDQSLTDVIRANVFDAIGLGIRSISIPAVHMGVISELMFDGMTLSVPVDWPNGRADTDLRLHEITKASHYGANSVDVVCNHTLFLNHKGAEFVKDVRAVMDFATKKSICVRFMVDHRKIENGNQFRTMLKILKDVGAEYVFCSTGHLVEDPIDNVILCEIATKMGLSAIANGNLYLPKHLEMAKNAGLFGVRFKNINALRNSMTGV